MKSCEPCGPAPTDPWQEHNQRLAALMVRARLRDVAAFEELYRLTARWMLARVRRMVDDGQAEDVLAEVYLQIWSSLESYDESRAHPGAWMAMLARSRALDHLRREKRRRSDGSAEALRTEAIDADSPDEQLSRAQEAGLLRLCIDGLDAKERLVLGLAYFRDCTQSQIATATGMPLGTVKQLMSGAQRKLRGRLLDRGDPRAVPGTARAPTGHGMLSAV